MQRRLMRPNLSEVKEKMSREAKETAEAKKKMPPPTDTHAENYYFLKQMNKKTLMAVVLADGEQVEGYLEWYDRNCFKLNRREAPNLLVYKRQVKYLYKLETEPETEPEKGPKNRSESTDARKNK
jgi:sRNA-binding regulator protein Hfq